MEKKNKTTQEQTPVTELSQEQLETAAGGTDLSISVSLKELLVVKKFAPGAFTNLFHN